MGLYLTGYFEQLCISWERMHLDFCNINHKAAFSFILELILFRKRRRQKLKVNSAGQKMQLFYSGCTRIIIYYKTCYLAKCPHVHFKFRIPHPTSILNIKMPMGMYDIAKLKVFQQSGVKTTAVFWFYFKTY